MMKRKDRGFTVAEITVVLVIILVIAAIALPKFGGLTTQGRVARARGDLQLFKVGIESLLLHENPNPLPADMNALLTALRNANPQVVPSVSNLFDPFAAPDTRYRYIRNVQCYVVFSVGPNGAAEINTVTNNCRIQFAGVLDDIFITNTDGIQGIV
jgi:prepilin-type N-terminal cleavage/methylation domain-containing protein